MYGYVFGAAVAGLRHNVVHSCQLYAGMAPWDDDSFDPFLIHYGIRIEIPDPSGSASERKDRNEKSLWAWDKHGELQGGPDARDKLSCAILSRRFRRFQRLVPTPATDGKTLTRGNAETRRVEIVRELMIALNEGVRWHRARACGAAVRDAREVALVGKDVFFGKRTPDARAAADGERRAARSSAEGVSRRKAAPTGFRGAPRAGLCAVYTFRVPGGKTAVSARAARRGGGGDATDQKSAAREADFGSVRRYPRARAGLEARRSPTTPSRMRTCARRGSRHRVPLGRGGDVRGSHVACRRSVRGGVVRRRVKGMR